MGAVHLAELIEQGRPALLAQYGQHLTSHQVQALDAMARCRTGALGATAMACSGCDQRQVRLRSCGHRSCPRCQHHAAVDWLERQRAKLVPAPYFMVTFTLPAALRPLAYRHPQAIYDLLFRTAIGTLRTFGLHHAELEAELAATAVLHTHTRRLDYHPHLHVIVPGAGIDQQRRWRKLTGRYLFNGRALARVFRARFIDGLKRAGFELPARSPARWIVQCQHVGQGLPALQYLSRYLYRGVIAEAQIVTFDHMTQAVTFRYQDGKTRRRRLRTLPLVEFLWRLMIHVLPSGYRRVRDYGFLHGNARTTRALIQVVLLVVIPQPPPRARACFRCPACQGAMTVIAVLNTRPSPMT
jgi:hypothetical protein